VRIDRCKERFAGAILVIIIRGHDVKCLTHYIFLTEHRSASNDCDVNDKTEEASVKVRLFR
jgi:hypothetical protein